MGAPYLHLPLNLASSSLSHSASPGAAGSNLYSHERPSGPI